MNEEILIPLAFFAFLAAIIILPQYYRSKSRERLMDTVRIAYDKGQPVPPELIDVLQRDDRFGVKTAPERDLRRAIVLIGVALGLCVFGALLYPIAGYEGMFGLLGGAAIPGFIGIGFLLLWLSRRNNTQA